jgi:hypothetical protein
MVEGDTTPLEFFSWVSFQGYFMAAFHLDYTSFCIWPVLVQSGCNERYFYRVWVIQDMDRKTAFRVNVLHGLEKVVMELSFILMIHHVFLR